MSTPLRTLIVEDNEDDALLLVRQLRRAGYEPIFERIDTAEAMEQALEHYSWDIIIADYRMPYFSGLDALEIMKLKGLDIPFIILSAVIIEDMAIVAMRNGARDCIMKDNLPRLFPAIERELQEADERRKRRQAEEDVRESEKKFRMLFDNASDAIFIHNLEGRFLEVNRLACERLGYSKEELLQMGSAELDSPEYAARIPEQLEELRQHGRVVFETALVGRDGTVIPVEMSSRMIDFSGAPAILSIARDISKRKQAEEEIRHLNAELEQRVRTRTAELEFANSELKNFAYVVSHDLKAPLRGISRLADWLMQDYAEAFDEDGREMVELLIGRVSRMDALIDGVLKYSRVGRIITDYEPIPLNLLVKDVIDLLAPPDNIRVTIDGELPEITGNRARLTQVFQNLIENAIGFMDKPEGMVRIGVQGEGEFWTFRIEDNGPGIAPQYHERIFTIFQTITSSEERENAGIGLALVKKIVELHGGKIWLESEPGQGSTFFFTLPRKVYQVKESPELQ